jgi:inosine triphosphate pyrophosphatase
MTLKFVTGNKNKFEEVRSVLKMPMEQVSVNLPEIQSLDAREVIRQKLLAVEQHEKGEYIVEDTSLYLSSLNYQLPGPFIKWFEKSITNDGIVQLAEKMGDNEAIASVIIGHIDETGKTKFFEGTMKGKIVPARGDNDFGWGPIFQPEGEAKTFGEMERDEKHAISMRGIAARKLKKYLSAS